MDKIKLVKRGTRLREETYKTLVDHMSDIIFLRDREGKLLYVTPSVKSLGYKPENFIGKTIWGLVHDDDRHLSKDWLQAVNAKEDKPFESIARVRKSDGSFLWLDTRSVVIRDKKGKFKFVLSTARDITNLKEEEKERQRLQTIIEEGLNEVCILDGETLRFIYCNKKLIENLGYSAKEFKTMGPQDISVDRPEKFFSRLFEPLLKGSQKQIFLTGKNKRKDGSSYNVESTFQIMTKHDRQYIVAVVQDVTALEKAREQLYQAQKMEVIGQLTGGIAHNFNNLLTPILGSLRLLEAREKDPDFREMLQVALRSAKRGAELTHRLLSFSRKQKLIPKAVDLRKVLEEIDGLLEFALGKSIEIQTTLKEKEFLVRVDEAEFESALLNLALNSRDAMPEGGILKISYDQEKVDLKKAEDLDIPEGVYVVTQVSDTGVGMDSEILKKVTEPFFTTKEIGKGSGLGLSMVFGFARQSGGTMIIKSKPKKGTTVKIYLPREE